MFRFARALLKFVRPFRPANLLKMIWKPVFPRMLLITSVSAAPVSIFYLRHALPPAWDDFVHYDRNQIRGCERTKSDDYHCFRVERESGSGKIFFELVKSHDYHNYDELIDEQGWIKKTGIFTCELEEVYINGSLFKVISPKQELGTIIADTTDLYVELMKNDQNNRELILKFLRKPSDRHKPEVIYEVPFSWLDHDFGKRLRPHPFEADLPQYID